MTPVQLPIRYELPARIEAALLAVAAQGQGSTDYIAMRAVALELLASGALAPAEVSA